MGVKPLLSVVWYCCRCLLSCRPWRILCSRCRNARVVRKKKRIHLGTDFLSWSNTHFPCVFFCLWRPPVKALTLGENVENPQRISLLRGVSLVLALLTGVRPNQRAKYFTRTWQVRPTVQRIAEVQFWQNLRQGHAAYI